MGDEHRRHTAGNEAADAFAKRGAEGDRGQGKEQVLQDAANKVKWVLDLIAEAKALLEQWGQWPDREAQGPA